MDNRGSRELVHPLYRYSLLAAAIIELGSLPVIGWSPLFAYGLALGTCIAVLNHNLLVISSKKVLEMGRGVSLALLGYILRLAIYGGAFYLSYKAGTVSGIATLFGYMTVKLGMFYVYGFRPGSTKKDYKNVELKDLDRDPWAGREAGKATRSGPIKKVMSIFQSENAENAGREEKKD